MTTQNKPREFCLIIGPNRSEYSVYQNIKPENVITESGAEVIHVREVLANDELEALRKELSETKSKLEASEWIRNDNALRTYDGLTERVKELEQFAKMAVEVVEEISTAAPRDDDHLTAPISNEARLRASWRKANRFKSSDIYKKVVGK